jgi:hypothetical protein
MRSAWLVMVVCSVLAGALGLHATLHPCDPDASALVVEAELDIEDVEDELDDDAAENCPQLSASVPGPWRAEHGVAAGAVSTSAADGWRSRPTRPPTA